MESPARSAVPVRCPPQSEQVLPGGLFLVSFSSSMLLVGKEAGPLFPIRTTGAPLAALGHLGIDAHLVPLSGPSYLNPEQRPAEMKFCGPYSARGGLSPGIC